jgi:hypothetical protein
MGQLVFQATAGGQVALVGPNPATNFSINVPAVNSTLATLAAQTFTGQQTDTVDASISGLTVGKGGGSVVSNSAFGQGALNNAGTGNYVTAIGYQSLYSNTTGQGGTAVGGYALYSNTTGTANTGIGGFVSTGSVIPALYSNTTGSYNIAVGTGALASNTTASSSTAVGYQAGYSQTTGSQNNFFGYQSGSSLTTGTLNTFIGSGAYGSGQYITTGSKNTILGAYSGNNAGLDIRTANNRIIISDGDGNPRFYASAGATAAYWIGFDGAELYPSIDNTISCGFSSLRWSVIYSATALINTSDANQKQQIANLTIAELETAKAIKGLIKSFKFNDAVAKKGNGARIHIGVIAQDVQAAFISNGLDPSKYAMFCSDTWHEVDGKQAQDPSEPFTKDTPNAVEITRLGIRYDELLAFVISTL